MSDLSLTPLDSLGTLLKLLGSAPRGDQGKAGRGQVFCLTRRACGDRMTKSELILRIGELNPHLYHRDVERIVTTIFEEITNALAKRDRVELRGFGSFRTVQREARIGKSPFTGEAFSIPAKRVPRFRASRCLRLQIAKLPVSASACASRSGGSAG